jgi:hypothetical protein
MEDIHEESDGSEIFWPGYVDATTNLALNLLFLLTIMITAVFMFALEMGRNSLDAEEKPQNQEVQIVTKDKPDQVEQIVTLKLEIQRLNKMLAQQDSQNVKPGGLEKSVNATLEELKPQHGLDYAQSIDFEVIIHFRDEAIALKSEERKTLLESLKPVVARGKSVIYVEVPAGFSEAKRMGFYRAMEVRNLLIEMKVPADKIDVSVVEGKDEADASLVMVR